MFKLNQDLAAGQVLGNGATLTVRRVPFPLEAGQELVLPSGQVLVTSAATNVGALRVPVLPATIDAAVETGDAIGAVGTAEVTVNMHRFGRFSVQFCKNSTTEPECAEGTGVTVPYPAGNPAVLYATTDQPKGTRLNLVLTTQAGRSKGIGPEFTV